MKSNLAPRLKKAVPYIIITAFAYLTLPLWAAYLQNGTFYTAVPILDCCVALLVGYFYGRVAKRDPIMPAFSAALFVPCMFVFFNITAWVYIPLTALASFIGECFGAVYQGKFGR